MSDARAAFSCAVAAVAFCVAWLSAAVLHLPLFWYLPLERQYVWTTEPAGLGMGLFGQLLFAAVTGAAVGAAVWRLTRGRVLNGTQVKLAVGGCVLIVCVVTGYYAFTMWGRVL